MKRSDTTAYISDLLYKYDCVILPGFGGFVTNYSSAEILPTSHYVTPPSKTVAFNEKLNSNDGLLINYIAFKQNISYREAADKVEQFVENLRNTLKVEKQVRLDLIGKFVLEEEGNIRFIPDLSVNHLAETYGLKRFHFDPLDANQHNYYIPVMEDDEIKIRSLSDLQETAEEKIKIEKVMKPVASRQTVSLLAAAAVFLVLLAVGQFIVFDTGTSVDTSSLNPFADNTEIATPEKPAETAIEEVAPEIKEEVAEEPVKENKPETAGPRDGAYVILGSFKDKSNAESLKAELEVQNLKAFIFEAPNGYNRVGYYVAPTEAEAESMLPSLKSRHGKDAWVYRHGASI